MKPKVSYQIKDPSDNLVGAFTNALRSMDKWRDLLQPTLDKAIDNLKADGHLSTSFAEAFDDLGRYCLSKGEEIRAERDRLGIGKPAKRPPSKY